MRVVLVLIFVNFEKGFQRSRLHAGLPCGNFSEISDGNAVFFDLGIFRTGCSEKGISGLTGRELAIFAFSFGFSDFPNGVFGWKNTKHETRNTKREGERGAGQVAGKDAELGAPASEP